MSSQPKAVPTASVTASPGMALVRRFPGPAPGALRDSLRVLPRLCLYALPVLWGMLLYARSRIGGIPDIRFSAHIQFLQVFFFAWIGAIECFRASSCHGTNREHTGAMNILKSVCTASIASALLLRMLGHALPSPAQGFSDAAVFLVLSVLTKVLLRTNFEARRPRTQLLVAQASAGTSDASWHLNRKEVSRHRISGAIQLQDMDSYLSAPVLTTEELLREIRLDRADGVLICAPSTAIFALSERLESWDGLNTPIRFIVGSAQGLSSRSHIAGADCLYLFNTGAEPAGTLNYRLLKRAFDIVFSLIAIAGCLPLMLLVALAVKMGSSGPALFSQDRVGWNGRVFRMYKFRTMHIAPEAESDVRWTPPDDPHRTPIGRFLRKYSLDELPQFFNVLKGDMSVVGPRPERPFFVNSFRKQIDEYHRRHQLKVGITGWAQVHGLRGDTCIRTRLMYDLYYLQHWGLIFDLKIILRTVLCIFKANNAY